MNDLTHEIEAIETSNEEARAAAKAHWAACAKPLGSLGRLEMVLEDIAALTGYAEIAVTPRALLVFCADHGVVAQGVTQVGNHVTAVVTRNLAEGGSAVCRMAQVANCPVLPFDMGILNAPRIEGVRACRLGNGTADMTQGSAMTREQAEAGILFGMRLVKEQRERGMRLLAGGEMGIGNTTSATAMACVLLGKRVEELTGRGAGLSDAGLLRKRAAIARAIDVNRPDPQDPLGVLAALGGFELAALCGLFLGGARYRVPVLLDGAIAAAAALCAARLQPKARAAMLAAHVSAEPSGALLLEALGKQPLICAEMRLGEGTGAVAAMPLLDMALAVYQQAASFDESGLDAYTPQELALC